MKWLSSDYGGNMNIGKSLNKQWIHSSELLLNGNITYPVKFLGECTVDEPRGTDIVREAVRKMRFNQHLKMSQGEKLQKCEIVISVHNVCIQDFKTKLVMHRYPLHRISYCADEKTDCRVFAFIAKDSSSDQHFCYGFLSDKSAQDITMSVGQAFDLAYRMYLDESFNDTDLKKQVLLLQRKTNALQKENEALKSRIKELEELKDSEEIITYKNNNNITDLTWINNTDPDSKWGGVDSDTINSITNQILSKRLSGHQKSTPNIMYQSTEPLTNSHHLDQSPPNLLPPPSSQKLRSQSPKISDNADIFEPPAVDIFGMEEFRPSSHHVDQALQRVSQELNDMRTGFEQGLLFGTDDFDVANLNYKNM